MQRRIIALLTVLLLALAACGGDDTTDEGAATATTEPPAESTETEMATEMDTEMSTEMETEMSTEMETEMGEATEGQTIVDIATSNEDFSTLAELVTTAGLAETLSGEGPFTVFAPTNEAFDAVDAATLEELQNDTDQLTTVLQNHVVEGAVTSDQLEDGMTVTTLAGNEVEVSIDGDTVMIGDATVTMADVEASNGVIHAIDTVLLP